MYEGPRHRHALRTLRGHVAGRQDFLATLRAMSRYASPTEAEALASSAPLRVPDRQVEVAIEAACTAYRNIRARPLADAFDAVFDRRGQPLMLTCQELFEELSP